MLRDVKRHACPFSACSTQILSSPPSPSCHFGVWALCRKVKACRCPVTQFCWETLEEALLADRGEGMVLTAETGPYQVLPAAEPWGRLVRVEEGIGGMSATHQAYDFLSLSIPRHSPRAWFCKVPSCSPALEIFTCLLSMSPFLFWTLFLMTQGCYPCVAGHSLSYREAAHHFSFLRQICSWFLSHLPEKDWDVKTSPDTGETHADSLHPWLSWIFGDDWLYLLSSKGTYGKCSCQGETWVGNSALLFVLGTFFYLLDPWVGKIPWRRAW